MSDDFTFTAGGLTLCKKTIFRWCSRDNESGKLLPVKGGTCACGADRLPSGNRFAPLFPEHEENQWGEVREPFPPLALVPPCNTEEEDK